MRLTLFLALTVVASCGAGPTIEQRWDGQIAAPCLPAPEQAQPGAWQSVGSICYLPDGGTIRCIVSCQPGPGVPAELCYVRACL